MEKCEYGLSKELIRALDSGIYGKLKNISLEEKKEKLTIEIGPLSIPQYPVFDVRKTEEVVVHIFEDSAPKVFCREDFPIVPHLNVYENGEKSLCLFEVPYEEYKYFLNGKILLNRIVNWFQKTAKNQLHREDQPNEPFFFGVQNNIYIRSFENFNYYARFVAQGSDLYEVVGDDSNKGELYIQLISVLDKPENTNIIKKIPKTIKELEEAFDVDVLAFLEKQILKVWEVKKTKDYKTLFQETEKNLRNCPVLIKVYVRVKDEKNANNTIYTGLKIFKVDGNFRELYEAFGYSKTKNNKLEKTSNAKYESINLIPYEMFLPFTIRLAKRCNGIDLNEEPIKFFQVGIGTLGSQIANNCIRSGFGKWSYLDCDRFLPHNTARHIFNRTNVGKSKIDEIKKYIDEIFVDSRHFLLNTYKNNIFDKKHELELIDEIKIHDVVVDCSASIAVERYISDKLANKTRCVSFFMNPSGTALVMLLEDKERKITLDLLEMQYYRMLYSDPSLFEHLKNEETTYYSTSCRSNSLKLSQDNISIFAGIASKIIKNLPLGGKIAIWNVSGLTINDIIKTPCECIKYFFDDWTVLVDQHVTDKLYELRKSKLPNETGGVLIGSYDFERKKCYVVDALPSPIDSIEKRSSYIRGTSGLKASVDQIKEITRDSLYYIGEWHTHPNDVTMQSELDKKLMRYVVENNEKEGIPAVMAIAGDTNISFYFEK